MSKKFLNIFFAVVMSAGLLGNASAAIITDSDGGEWEYVGEFVLGAGPFWEDANGCDLLTDPNLVCVRQNALALNGLQAAEVALGALVAGHTIATSTVRDSVNFLAWYDTVVGPNVNVEVLAESQSLIVDKNNDGLYNVEGDMSAYVFDRTDSTDTDRTTFVFKAVEVSEPSILALFSLALFGFGVRQYKKS